MSRSGIAKSYSSSVFSFLRNLHTIFHIVWTSIHSPQQWTRVSFPPHPCQHLLLVFFLMIAILRGVRCSLIVVLIWFPGQSVVLRIFMWLSPVCIYSLEKCLFGSAHFLIRWYVFFWSCMSCLYMLDINPLSVVSFVNIYSHSVSCLFVLSVCFAKALSLIWVPLVYICFCFLCL